MAVYVPPDLRKALQKWTNELNIGPFIDDEGERLAENLGINITQSIRQQRNDLEAAMDSGGYEEDLIDLTDLDLTPKQQRDIEASFKQHTRAGLRKIADEIGKDLNSEIFMGVDPEHPPVVLKLHEHAAGNFPTLAEHPHDVTLSVPIPPEYEDLIGDAVQLLPMNAKERAAARAAAVAKAKLK